ncbi:MAG: IS21 family transposase [Bradymonadaceae bacterium]|nr:IS21 family transposase [Lujinxingiaceae bacterium]
MVTDTQVWKLMDAYEKKASVTKAAMHADMDRKTASKYLQQGKLPSQIEKPVRSWRTREDPFDEDWPELALRLKDAPELEAKTLFEDLLERKPEHYEQGQLRTFQRKVKRWRAQMGPDKEVFFPQQHRAGEALQTDFTFANRLGITLGGEPFEHLLCNVVLPYSNWQCVTICRSESMAALSEGIQEAVFRLGRVPQFHQTDNSTAATHNLGSGKRAFNDTYLDLMRHLGMVARTIGIGKSEQNGDVESSNGALKRRLEQHLLLRESRDFDSIEAYRAFLEGVVTRANRTRERRFLEEFGAMKVLAVKRLPAYAELVVKVTSWSTIRVKYNSYSVPSRLIGERVVVRVWDERLEVWHAQSHQLSIERLVGRAGHLVDYRHVIWSMVQKPAAFERYRWREALFPTLTFRKAYDALSEQLDVRGASVEYLRVLHLAASTGQAEVERALELLLEAGGLKSADPVKKLVDKAPRTAPADVASMVPIVVDLKAYDSLLSPVEVSR